MKKLLLGVLLVAFTLSSGYGQRWKLKRYEVLGGIGTANVFGDMGVSPEEGNLFGLKDIQGTRVSGFVGARYKLAQNHAVRLNLIYGYATGQDKGMLEQYRNFSFTTMLFEPSLQYEYYLIPEEKKYKSAALFNSRGMVNNFARVSIYLFGGAGGVYAMPQLYAPDLDPEIETELGNGFSAVFPAGIGLKMSLDSDFSIGIELGGRYTLGDNLDGFTTIYSNANDVYYFGLANVIYKLRTNRKGVPMIFQKVGNTSGARKSVSSYRRQSSRSYKKMGR